MKHLLFVILLTAALAGCATSNYSVGRDFPSEKVPAIVKGETTASQVEAWFGQPFSKSVLSASQEKWLYSHAVGQAKATMGSVTTSGTQRMLDILIDDGVVVNYTFTEGPQPYSITN